MVDRIIYKYLHLLCYFCFTTLLLFHISHIAYYYGDLKSVIAMLFIFTMKEAIKIHHFIVILNQYIIDIVSDRFHVSICIWKLYNKLIDDLFPLRFQIMLPVFPMICKFHEIKKIYFHLRFIKYFTFFHYRFMQRGVISNTNG